MRSRRSSGEPGLRVGDGLGCGRSLEVLSDEIGEAVTFRTVIETELISRLIRAGVSPGQVELLVAREWAVRAGKNERLTGEVGRLAGHEPRAVREFLHDFRSAFA
jgi:NAD(P)H dehydrogenase (quinone)